MVTEALPFNTVERENAQLPKGTRKVVQEGNDGEKTTLVEVTIENGQETSRLTRDSFVSKSPVDKIVEIGKPVEQVTPDQGIKNLVVEQPRLDIVTEALPFNTVERENPQLPKGTRKVVQEGKAGEKTTLVEVTIENSQETGRTTRDSFVSKDPVDKIVEIGKPVEQVAPDQGLKNLVVEQPRLDVVTEALPFNTVERKNPQLPKGIRKVVQEGKAGEKTTLVEVTIENGQETGRVTRDSFVSKDPVDQIVEVGKPVEQVTPDQGIKNLVVEQPRLDIVTEVLPFNTVERENPQLPKGTRKVVQEGKDGEKTTLVEVAIENGQETGRITRDSFVSKAPVDQIVEVGKPVEQVTPDQGLKNLVVEQPRLDIVTEALPFNTIERENPQLSKGTRKVIQEGKAGEKTTLVEVTIENGRETGRVTRDSFVSKDPVDQIVEVGSKEEKPNKPTTPEKPVEPSKPSKPENNLRILTDEATKVQVIGMKSTLDQVVALKVKKVAAQSLEGKLYDAYDIRLEDQFGKAVQPKGKVFVSLPVASNKDVENVFFMIAANQLDAVSFQQKGHYVEYMTDQLGVYAVVYKSTATPQMQEQVQGSKVDGSTKGRATKSATLPSTGTATDSAFLLGLLLALTGLFLMKKKENM
nr:G5 domain-containing protein [Streptococcus cristatus]